MWKRTVQDVDGFDRFWSGFLRREKKQAARDAFRWAMQNHNGDGMLLQRILDTLEWQREITPDRQFWTTPDKWLLGMRWEDERPSAMAEQARRAVQAAADAEWLARRKQLEAEAMARGER